MTQYIPIIITGDGGSAGIGDGGSASIGGGSSNVDGGSVI